MRIAILAAMEKERALLLPLLENRRDEDYEGLTVSVGRIGRHEVGVARCGIGKVNSAINAYKCIRGFGPQLVVNSGVAGGAGATRIGDLLVADYVSYHDVWCGPRRILALLTEWMCLFHVIEKSSTLHTGYMQRAVCEWALYAVVIVLSLPVRR